MLGIVINPRAGNGRGERIWAQVRAELDRRGVPYEAACTEAAGEGACLAAALAARPGIGTLLVIGGDGTIHEAAAGLWHLRAAAVRHAGGAQRADAVRDADVEGDGSRDTAGGAGEAAALRHAGEAATAGATAATGCALAAIPAGTGNDFAKAFGLPADPLLALELALTVGKPRPLDVLLAGGGGLAVNSFGAGFDGLVAKLTNEAGYKKLLNRFKLGSLAYLITVLRVFAGYQPCDAELVIDGERHELRDMWLVAAANIPFYGGSMQICPGASPHDGQVDVVVICSRTRLRLLPILAAVYKGRHVGHPAVRFFRGRHAALTTAKPLYVHADGEQYGATPLRLEVVPAALTVIGAP
ncbi:diacylglycerol kinase family lipid kinase [Paenibacillus athensensis]|uniref:DAGKc domain-containing protein n=1 Tax=Paenibacillus athensensis TaxID=1967502 RepID=A0A4Y8Q0L7_9BACL|nr:diacylglycerol kinase family protein [Paenibacillus athensensis]MCD1258297.1 diacylglycerol kinase family lipid kinase [Paenibacillus athensensis]